MAMAGPSQFLQRQHSGQAGVVYSFSGQVRSSPFFIGIFILRGQYLLPCTHHGYVTSHPRPLP
jgi:hypothetical protein